MKTTIECPHCKGSGKAAANVCISEYAPPVGHENEETLCEISDQAVQAVSDHGKLCLLNPRAKESYDRQLAEVLAKFEADATALL